MSDLGVGARCWRASDGKWYPPELHPDAPAKTAASTPAPAPSPPTSRQGTVSDPSPRPARSGRRLVAVRGLVVVLVAGVILYVSFSSSARHTATGPLVIVPTAVVSKRVPTSTGRQLPGGARALRVPAHEHEVRGGDIGTTKTVIANGQRVQVTLVAVVNPVTTASGGPATTDLSGSAPTVGVELSLHNTGERSVPLATVTSEDGGSGDEYNDLLVSAELGPQDSVGADYGAGLPLGRILDMSEPLQPGGTQTGWLNVELGHNYPGEPTTAVGRLTGVSVGFGSQKSATWRVP